MFTENRKAMIKNVRFSQMSLEDRKKFNSKLVGILKTIMRVCEENNISWYVGYGGCIGAIRHKGCIPWDDDIDVCMPRPDYDRFVEICKKTDLGDYELATINDTPYYFEYIVRMYDKNSTLYFYKQLKHVGGIFVDIFPLDGAGNELNSKKVVKNLQTINFWQVFFHQSHFYYTPSQRRGLLLKGRFSLYSVVLLTTLFRSWFQKYSLKRIEQALYKYSYQNSDYVMFYERTYRLKNMIRKEWINETIFVPFEDIQVRIPKYYHEYLFHIYGDYMTPPPIEKRDDRHVFAFIDMEKRWSLEDIRKELSKES